MRPTTSPERSRAMSAQRWAEVVKVSLRIAGVLVVGVVFGRIAGGGGWPVSERGPSLVAINGKSIAGDRLTNVMGKGRAVLVEFTDFECPVCARFATQAFPHIVERYVATGQLG